MDKVLVNQFGQDILTSCIELFKLKEKTITQYLEQNIDTECYMRYKDIVFNSLKVNKDCVDVVKNLAQLCADAEQQTIYQALEQIIDLGLQDETRKKELLDVVTNYALKH
jgi:hypothetical protein